MRSSTWLLLLFLVSITLQHLVAQPIIKGNVTCTPRAELCWSCADSGKYTNGSIFQQNLITLLSSFSNNTSSQKEPNFAFHNSSLGQGSNRVNAIALCRGDLGLQGCSSCLSDSTQILLSNCSYRTEAILWAEPCMVRYSQDLIFGIEEEDPYIYLPSPHNAIKQEAFRLVQNPLLEILSDRAASGDSVQKYATGHATVPGSETIYAHAQCTPDMDKLNCSNCLKNCISALPVCCGGKSGARVLTPSCNIRFENNLYYMSTADSEVNISALAPVPPETPAPAGKKSNTTKYIIIVVEVVVAFVIMLLGGICIFRRVKKLRGKRNDDFTEEVSLVESLQYDFKDIKSATNDFSDENKLGQGGFGAVYKGRHNGRYIAVKRLFKSSGQGDREFINEVTLVAQLQHRNLVRLLGFCLKGEERLLIYEYIPNRSLDRYIFDTSNKHGHLDWETRHKIIGGIVRGLLYLHEDSRLRIIHRDLKSSNILLDEDMVPKIADFGMAKLFGMDQTQGDTKTIVGTYGYMAPEYASHGRFSVKSDVFSFGVLVLELITGRKIGSFRIGENEDDLLSYAWRNWRDDTIQNIIDPMLTTGSRYEIIRCIHIGLLCVQENVNDRPTMALVVSMLNSHSLALSVPSRPPHYWQYNTDSDTSGSGARLIETSDKQRSSVYVLSRSVISDITELHPR